MGKKTGACGACRKPIGGDGWKIPVARNIAVAPFCVKCGPTRTTDAMINAAFACAGPMELVEDSQYASKAVSAWRADRQDGEDPLDTWLRLHHGSWPADDLKKKKTKDLIKKLQVETDPAKG